MIEKWWQHVFFSVYLLKGWVVAVAALLQNSRRGKIAVFLVELF